LVFQGGIAQSVYLEPLFNYKKWSDPTNAKDATLAHELFGSFRGQYAFGSRLIPQAEQVLGGLYTVRGYPESIANGDSMFVGTVEYRYHVPRDFSIEPEPRKFMGQDFRWAPQYVYGRPDWDLILRAFFDGGRTYNSNRQSFESDDTLLGTGIGVEFVFRRNLDVRLDWGIALKDVPAANVDAGDNRLHFVLTVLF
jgi:hemolysin activation/secretion protein